MLFWVRLIIYNTAYGFPAEVGGGVFGWATAAVLFALAVDVGLWHTVGSSTPVKNILNQSGIYDSVVDSFLEQGKAITYNGSSVSLTDPGVKQAAQASYSSLVKTDTEQAIDSIYRWLDGQTAEPDFKLDFSTANLAFASGVGALAQQRATGLPACPAGSNTSLSNLVSANCLPKGVTPTQVADLAKQTVINGDGALQPEVSATDIKSSENGPSVFADQLKDLPNTYQSLKIAPLLLTIISLALMAAIILLSLSHAKGLRHVGFSLFAVGVALLIFAWLLNWAVNQKVLPKVDLDNKVLQEKVKTLASDVSQNIDKTYYTIVGVYAALGVLAIATVAFIHRGQGERRQTEAVADEPKPVAAPKPQELKPATPKKKTIKIQ